MLTRAAEIDEATVTVALHELLEAHVLVREHDDVHYAFRHALAREAMYADLLVPERRDLHARMAHALEATSTVGERGAGEWSALAHHWDAAGDPGRALGAAIAAAQAASAVYAFSDARRQLERALASWDDVSPGDRPADIDESELLRRLAEATRLTGHSEDAIPIAERALAALPSGGDPRRAVPLELLLSLLVRDRDRSVEHAQRALALLRRVLGRALGSRAADRERPCLRRPSQRSAAQGARSPRSRPGCGRGRPSEAAHRIIGGALAWGGETEAGLEHLRKAGRVALEHDRAEDHIRAMDHLGAALDDARAHRRAIDVYDGAMAHARAVGSRCPTASG